MTITTEDNGNKNMWAKEPQMYIDPTIQKKMDNNAYETHNERAEKLNGRVAMLSLMSALLSYAFTHTLAWGLF